MCWNKHTGLPYANAIVWSDVRTSEICERISSSSALGKDKYRVKTGLPVSTYFSASKLIYLLESIPGLREDANKGDALFGTIDTWLLYKLTGHRVHATDVSNASRTLMMNLKTLQWDDDIIRDFNIPRTMLPNIFPSSFKFGFVMPENNDSALTKLTGVPICSLIG